MLAVAQRGNGFALRGHDVVQVTEFAYAIGRRVAVEDALPVALPREGELQPGHCSQLLLLLGLPRRRRAAALLQVGQLAFEFLALAAQFAQAPIGGRDRAIGASQRVGSFGLARFGFGELLAQAREARLQLALFALQLAALLRAGAALGGRFRRRGLLRGLAVVGSAGCARDQGERAAQCR